MSLTASASPPSVDGARPVVLVTVRHYLPGYRSGGPVRSLSRLVEELGEEFDIRVVCLDRDTAEKEPYPGVEPLRWTPVGHAQVMYLAPRDRTAGTWHRVFAEIRPDLLYANSLFDPWFSMQPVRQARRLGVPALVAPRGELSAGALAQKRLKKRIALAFFRILSFHSAVQWHACSQEEVIDIRSHLRPERARIVMVPNLPSVAPAAQVARAPKVSGSLRVMFLSRLSPKKNLLGAIRVVARAGPGIEFDIWGPPEDEAYVNTCRKAAGLAPPGTNIRWCGPIPHHEVSGRMASYDVFLFPTLGENFGHVIFEALASGLPVITSDQTPWRGLQDLGVGADLSVGDEEAFVHQLGRFKRMGAQELLRFRLACLAFAGKWAAAHPGIEAYRVLWTDAMSVGPRHRGLVAAD